MVREAGGQVTNFEGEPHQLTDRDLLSSNGTLHAAMLEVLSGAD